MKWTLRTTDPLHLANPILNVHMHRVILALLPVLIRSDKIYYVVNTLADDEEYTDVLFDLLELLPTEARVRLRYLPAQYTYVHAWVRMAYLCLPTQYGDCYTDARVA